ncbi:MAG: hypothetical protein AAFV53_40675, partial [Myxococcota bacterium]
FIPLFNLLGYESAAAMGAAVGIATLLRTGWLFWRGHLTRPLDPNRPRSPSRDFFALLPMHLGLIGLPALLLTLNALRVQNCDLLLGAQFWLVIPTGAVVMGQMIPFLVAAVLPRGIVAASIGVLIVEALAFGIRFAIYPPITGHEWMIGYFSGSIYDEALSLPASLLWFRVLCAAWAVGAVLLIELGWRWRTGRARLPIVAGLIACLVVWGGLQANRFPLGISVTTQDAIETLGGRLETEHFVIYYDPQNVPPDKLSRLEADHEFHYARHAAYLDVDIVAWRGRKIEVFVYPNREVQKRLLGSRNTLVARPWSHQMHIRWDGHGAGAVGHEMAHLFSAAFGATPLQLPMSGWSINVGMIEGVAEAADWAPDPLDLHQASAALRRRNQAADLRRLFNPAGFWSQPSRRAYTLMGSFSRSLIERYGVGKYKRLYQTGDFEAAYDRSAADLVTEWEGFVDGLPLTDHEQALADTLYSRGSIFERVCARTIGELQRQATIATNRGNTDRAIALWEQIVGFEPGNVYHRMSLAAVLGFADRFDEALDVLDVVLGEELSPAQRARALEQRGDLLWRSGQPAEAAAIYAECLQTALPDGSLRQLEVKRYGASLDPEQEQLARRYLFASETRAEGLYTAMRWSEQTPDDPVPRYLAGFQLVQLNQHADAIEWLSLDAPMEIAQIDAQRRLLLAKSHLLTGDLENAETIYRTLVDVPSHRVRRTAEDGLERIVWWHDAP